MTQPRSPTAQRLAFLDVMRGGAVALMVLGHTRCLLRPDLKQPGGGLIDAFNLLSVMPLPMFWLCSGITLSIVWGRLRASVAERSHARRRHLGRIAQILAAGAILHANFLPVWSHPQTWLQLGVLPLLSLTLLAVWLLDGLIGHRPGALGLVCAVAAVGLIAAAPWQAAQATRSLAMQDSSVLAKVPLARSAAYLLLGVAVGTAHIRLRPASEGDLASLRSGLAALAFGGLALALLQPWPQITVDSPGHVGQGLAAGAGIGWLALHLCALADRWTILGRLWGPAHAALAFLSRYALSAFVFHAFLLFHLDPLCWWDDRREHVVDLLAAWRADGGQLGWGGYLAVAAGLLLATAALCWAWARVWGLACRGVSTTCVWALRRGQKDAYP